MSGYVIAPYVRDDLGAARPTMRCSLASVLPPQKLGEPPSFDESEGRGGYAIALILDDDHLATARASDGVLALPASPILGRVGDSSTASERRIISDVLAAQGWSTQEVMAGIPKVGRNGDIANVSMLSLLRFMVSTRLKARIDENGEIVRDGPPQWTKPLPLPPMAGGAFPTAGVLDDFTGNENPRTGWTDSPDGSSYGNIRSLSGVGFGASGDVWVYYSATGPYALPVEGYMTVPTLTGAATSGEVDLLESVGSSSVDGYAVETRPGAGVFRIYRMDNSTNTQLGADITQAFSAGDALGMEISSGTLTPQYKASAGSWSALSTRSDSTYTSDKYAGFYMVNATGRVDDFGGGTVVAASGTNPRRRSLLGVGV